MKKGVHILEPTYSTAILSMQVWIFWDKSIRSLFAMTHMALALVMDVRHSVVKPLFQEMTAQLTDALVSNYISHKKLTWLFTPFVITVKLYYQKGSYVFWREGESGRITHWYSWSIRYPVEKSILKKCRHMLAIRTYSPTSDEPKFVIFVIYSAHRYASLTFKGLHPTKLITKAEYLREAWYIECHHYNDLLYMFHFIATSIPLYVC